MSEYRVDSYFLEKKTCVRVTRDKGGAGLTTFDEQAMQTNIESTLGRIAFSMAGETMGFENRTDVTLIGQSTCFAGDHSGYEQEQEDRR